MSLNIAAPLRKVQLTDWDVSKVYAPTWTYRKDSTPMQR